MYDQIEPYIRFYLCHLDPCKFIRLLLNTQMNHSKHEMRLIAKMRGIKVKKSSKTELFRIIKKDKITYNEAAFKSIIADISSELS